MRNLRMRAAPALFLSAALLGWGCGEKREAAPQEPVVVRVGDLQVTAGEVQARLSEQPLPLRSRYATPDGRTQFAEELIRSKLLVQEARKRGLDKDPEFVALFDRLLIQRLLQSHKTSPAEPLSDEEVRAFYEEHRSDFIRAERLRTSHILLAAASGSPKRAEAEREAQRLSEELRGRQAAGDVQAFAVLARARSEDLNSKPLGGDLGFKTVEELSSLLGGSIASVAPSLKTPGDIQVVKTEKGIHLVRLTARQAEINQPLESARPRIESRIQLERRQGSLETLVGKLRKETKVEIHEAALEAALRNEPVARE